MTFQEAKELIETEGRLSSTKTLVLSKEGCIRCHRYRASRIVEQYCRPTVMIALDANRKRFSPEHRQFRHPFRAQALRGPAHELRGHRHAAGLLIRSRCDRGVP